MAWPAGASASSRALAPPVSCKVGAPDGAFTTPAEDLALDWGPSNGDVRHRGNISFGTASLRGLSASVNFTGSSARPLTIRTGFDDNGDLIYNDRPEGVGRNANELVRKLEANVHLMAHPDEACPANWTKGAKTLKPNSKMVGKVYEALQG